ncbi:MAG: hypothetical protein WBM00_08280 [Solirubrobacterales bacterium]
MAAHRMRVLDDLWTAQLDSIDPNDQGSLEREFEGIQALGTELQEAVRELPEPAQILQMMLSNIDDRTFDEALDTTLQAAWETGIFAGEPGAPLRSEDFSQDSLRLEVIDACTYIMEQASDEEDLISEKLRRLETGEFQRGDVRFPFRCAGWLLLCGGGVALVVATGGGVPLIIAGVAVDVGKDAYSWKDSGCPKAWREIRQHKAE